MKNRENNSNQYGEISMRNMLKIALFALAMVTSSVNAGSWLIHKAYSMSHVKVAPNLPHIAGFPEIKQFNHLPYPLNYMETYKALDTKQQKKLAQQLPENEAVAFSQCKDAASKEFPRNVLQFIEKQIHHSYHYMQGPPKTHDRPWSEFTELLRQYPEIITERYPGSFIVLQNYPHEQLLPDGKICTDKKVPSQVTLAMRIAHTEEFGFLERILEAGFDPRTHFPLPEYPHQNQKPFFTLESLKFLASRPVLPSILAYVARNNDCNATQNRYQQLTAALEDNVQDLGPDLTKLILDFTPLEAVAALQRYREDGKSLLDMELEKLGQLDQSNPEHKYKIQFYQRNISMLIKGGVPAVSHPELLEQHIKHTKRKRRSHWRRAALIAGACAAGVAGLAYWWFNKK